MLSLAGDRDIEVGQVAPLQSAAVSEPSLAAGVLDQDAPHGLRRRRKKMTASIPLVLARADQTQVGFMHQRGGLKGLAGLLLGHLVGGQPAQLTINQRQQFTSRLGIALLNRFENAGHLAHAGWDMLVLYQKRPSQASEYFNPANTSTPHRVAS